MDPNHFTDKVNEALMAARSLALQKSHPEFGPLHVLLALLNDGNGIVRHIINKTITSNSPSGGGSGGAYSLDSVISQVNIMLGRIPKQDPPPSEISPTPTLMRVIRDAMELQKKAGDSHLSADQLLLALCNDSDCAAALKQGGGISSGAVERITRELRGTRKVDSPEAEGTFAALEKYSIDLIGLAESGKLDPVIGRDEEIRRVIRILSRRTKNNPVLLGEPGTGKTAIVEGLAQRMVRGDVPKSLRCKLVSLDMGALVAGAKYRGEFEERLKAVLKEVKESPIPIVMFIDEIHTVLGAGQTSEGSMDAANMLKPMLARGELRCIGATTLGEYRKYVEKDPAFERRFQQVYIGEPSVPDTVSILRGLKEKYESHHGVKLHDSALVAAATLSARYITNRFLPDKAIDLIDEACANVRVQLDSAPEQIDQLQRRELQLEVEATALDKEAKAGDEGAKRKLNDVREELVKIRSELLPLRERFERERAGVQEIAEMKRKMGALLNKAEAAERRNDVALAADIRYGAIPELEKRIKDQEKQNEQRRKTTPPMVSEIVGPEQIADVVSKWTGIPVTRLTQSDKQRLLTLAERLKKSVIGQDEAVDAVAQAILRSRAGLAGKGRPTASFLFCGPSGVGKTELAKALARELFDDERHVVRLDGSEYSEAHSVSRLQGSPPGYVGHEEGGQLTEAVRRRPYTVVLFDEVEKAHPLVWNAFLQILDDGRMTDGQGRTVDFSNTLIILTSNLGSEYLLAGINPDGTLMPSAKDQVLQTVRKAFRPEWINRLDDILVFNPLTKQTLQGVTNLLVKRVGDRLAEQQQGVQLEFTPAAVDLAIQSSFEAAYGARPIRRWLDKNLVSDLSKKILSGEISGPCTIVVSAADGQLSYQIVSTMQDQAEPMNF